MIPTFMSLIGWGGIIPTLMSLIGWGGIIPTFTVQGKVEHLG